MPSKSHASNRRHKEDRSAEEPKGIPAREMIADMLLEAKRPQQALVEYQTDLKLKSQSLRWPLRPPPAPPKPPVSKRRHGNTLAAAGKSVADQTHKAELGHAKKISGAENNIASNTNSGFKRSVWKEWLYSMGHDSALGDSPPRSTGVTQQKSLPTTALSAEEMSKLHPKPRAGNAEAQVALG